MTTTITEFFIAFTEGYDDPITIHGPFASYDEAVQAHFQQAVESGAVEEEFSYAENAHNYYLYDDAVRIARLDRTEKEPR